MESSHVTAIIIASLICGTIAIWALAQAIAERLDPPSAVGAGSVARVVGRGSER